MTERDVSYTDIKETLAALVALVNPNFNTWEKNFLASIKSLVELDCLLSKRQLYYLYRLYYRHVENDPDEFEKWCREHKLLHLHGLDYSNDNS